MTHDITYCTSTACPKVETCRRAEKPEPPFHKWTSFTDFYSDDKECEFYWEQMK